MIERPSPSNETDHSGANIKRACDDIITQTEASPPATTPSRMGGMTQGSVQYTHFSDLWLRFVADVTVMRAIASDACLSERVDVIYFARESWNGASATRV